MAAALFEALWVLFFIIFTNRNRPFLKTDPRIYLSRIVSRCQLSTRGIKVWIRPQDHNLRASIISSEALAHSIHVGLLPGLFLMHGEDGWPALVFKGRGQRIKDVKSPFRLLSVGADER